MNAITGTLETYTPFNYVPLANLEYYNDFTDNRFD